MADRSLHWRTRASAILAVMVVMLVAGHQISFALSLPPNDGFVTDTAGVLTESEISQLKTELERYRQATSNEIAIVIVPSLEGEAIEDVAQAIFRTWGIGTKANDNGVLILIARNDRALRIEVGYGLEGAIPDVVASGIINTDLIPHIRVGEYKEGLYRAVDSIEKHIGNEYTADRYDQNNGISVPSGALIFLFVALQWMIAILERTRSWWLGGIVGGVIGVTLGAAFAMWLSIPVLIVTGLLLDYFVSKNYRSRGKTAWWAGGGWGPGGGGMGTGGGFGGFGGGSTGGGGASGRW